MGRSPTRACATRAARCAPIATGYIVAATHSFAGAFIAATVFLVIGIAGYVFLLGRMNPIPDPAYVSQSFLFSVAAAGRDARARREPVEMPPSTSRV